MERLIDKELFTQDIETCNDTYENLLDDGYNYGIGGFIKKIRYKINGNKIVNKVKDNTGDGKLLYSQCVNKCNLFHPLNANKRHNCLKGCSDKRDSRQLGYEPQQEVIGGGGTLNNKPRKNKKINLSDKVNNNQGNQSGSKEKQGETSDTTSNTTKYILIGTGVLLFTVVVGFTIYKLKNK